MTYVALANITLGSSASSVTFSSIPATYRDLVLVYSAFYSTSGNAAITMRLNSDSGANYSTVRMYGNGSTPTSDTNPAPASTSGIDAGFFNDSISSGIQQFMDYSATDKHKTVLGRHTLTGTGFVLAQAARWANTAAITTISLTPDSRSFATGSTFALYAIAS